MADIKTLDALLKKINTPGVTPLHKTLEDLLNQLEVCISTMPDNASHYQAFRGIKEDYKEALQEINVLQLDNPNQRRKDARGNAKQSIVTFIHEVRNSMSSKPLKVEDPKNKKKSNKIFVVHGQDNAMRDAVARLLEKLGLKPIILQEQLTQGRTIIESFEEWSDVEYAVVLLSPDDTCSTGRSQKTRARQNVILELGYFVGKIGRKHVFMLYKEKENFEIPSNINGVLYTKFNDDEGWKVRLVKELMAAGYEVNPAILYSS